MINQIIRGLLHSRSQVVLTLTENATSPLLLYLFFFTLPAMWSAFCPIDFPIWGGSVETLATLCPSKQQQPHPRSLQREGRGSLPPYRHSGLGSQTIDRDTHFPAACLCAEEAEVEWFLASATSWAHNSGSVRKPRIHGVEPRALVLTIHFHSVNFPTVEWGGADRDTGHTAHLLYVYSALGQLSPTKKSQPVLPGGFPFPLHIYLLYAALDPSTD